MRCVTGGGAEALRRGAGSAGPLGRERVSADALLREAMGDAAVRRRAVSAGALGCEWSSADALPREVISCAAPPGGERWSAGP
jgi:hypothetical protein